MKNKEGRRTSHSYWSWTDGPRETTHNSSGRRPWWWRSSRWRSSPPAGCREGFSWCSRSWKRRRRRNRDEIAKKSSCFEGFGRRFKYMPKGGIGGASGGPGAPPARPRGGAARAPGALVAPPPAVLRAHGRFWNADFLYNFSGFFLTVLVM